MQSELMNKRELEEKSKRTRAIVCMVVVIVCFALFVARLVDWQIFHGEEYRSTANHSTGYTMETEAIRGEILDRNGVGLVVNKTRYRVVLDKLYIDEDKLDSTVIKLKSLLDSTKQKCADSLPIVKRGNVLDFKTNSDEEREYLMSGECLNISEYSSAQVCFESLVNRYELTDKYNAEDLYTLVSVYYDMERQGWSNSSPYIFADDVSEKTVAVISENTQGVSGVAVQTYNIREAENDSLAPHLLGATGLITEDELKEKNKDGQIYLLNDKIGKFGIELACEEQLKGKSGTKVVQKNADGTVIDTTETENAQPGNTVWLTIDSKLQKTAVKALEKNVKAAKKNGETLKIQYGKNGYGEDCEAGAVVMLDVKDFSVLAAASYPTYRLNEYSKYDDYYVRLSQNKHAPMYNRAFVGSFACGSVFKPITAAASLEEKVIKTNEQIYCNGSYNYYPTNVVKCMHYHGNVNLSEAMAQSCNCYFAEAGRRLGVETMYLYAERFGLGEYTGVEVEESKGTLAGRDSREWVAGNTVQAAIGQSDNAFTPLQLAVATATIANDGKKLPVHIIDRLTDYEREKTVSQYKSTADSAQDCGVSKKNLDIVRQAMYDVANTDEGTAYSVFGDYKVKIGAKTGTAENSGSDHAAFICYAPFDKPEVAVAVVLENGAFTTYSMDVAKALLDDYFKSR